MSCSRNSGRSPSRSRTASATAARVFSSSGKRAASGLSAVAGVARPERAASASTAESKDAHVAAASSSLASASRRRRRSDARGDASETGNTPCKVPPESPSSDSSARFVCGPFCAISATAPANARTALSAATSSAGVAVPWNTRARFRSASPAPWYRRSAAGSASRRPPESGSAVSASSRTASSRSRIARTLVSGCATQRRRSRAPPAVIALAPRSHTRLPRCVSSDERNSSSCRMTFGESRMVPPPSSPPAIGLNAAAEPARRDTPSRPNGRSQSNAVAAARAI